MALALAGAAPLPASAQDVSVEAESCDTLDIERVEALIEVELSASRLGDRAIEVRLRCDPMEVQIRVQEPLSVHHLERTLPRPRDEAPERAMAIAIAQLLTASWTELILSLEELRLRSAPPLEVATPVEEPSEAPIESPPAAPALRIDLRVGARAHDFVAPFPTFRGTLALGVPVIPELSIVGALAFETGLAERSLGSVMMQAYQLALGVELPLARAGVFALTADVLASGGYVVLSGEPASATSRGATRGGFGGDLALGVAAWLVLDRLHLGLRASIGAGLGVKGRVWNEPSVRYGRGFADLSFVIGVGL